MTNKTLHARRLIGLVAGAALLLGSSSVAFAQTYANPDGTGSIIPSTDTAGTGSGNTTTGTGTGTGTNGNGSVLGESTSVPNVPNTGVGGDAAAALALIGLTGAAAAAGAVYLIRQRFAL